MEMHYLRSINCFTENYEVNHIYKRFVFKFGDHYIFLEKKRHNDVSQSENILNTASQ